MTGEEYVEQELLRKYCTHNYLDKKLKKAFEDGVENEKQAMRAALSYSMDNLVDLEIDWNKWPYHLNGTTIVEFPLDLLTPKPFETEDND